MTSVTRRESAWAQLAALVLLGMLLPYVIARWVVATWPPPPVFDRDVWLTRSLGSVSVGFALVSLGAMLALGWLRGPLPLPPSDRIGRTCSSAFDRALPSLMVTAGLPIALQPYAAANRGALAAVLGTWAAVGCALTFSTALAGRPRALLLPVLRHHGPHRLFQRIPSRAVYAEMTPEHVAFVRRALQLWAWLGRLWARFTRLWSSAPDAGDELAASAPPQRSRQPPPEPAPSLWVDHLAAAEHARDAGEQSRKADEDGARRVTARPRSPRGLLLRATGRRPTRVSDDASASASDDAAEQAPG